MGIGSVLLIIVGILLSAGPNAAMAKVIYVTPAGNDAGDGLSWATAKKTVSAGLSTAQSGDEIWVTAGTYTPTSGTDRTIALQLKSGVGLYGGFAGTETLRTQRDSNVNITTLSGDLSGNDGSNFSNNAENSYHVVTGSGTDASAVLDGFAIVGGNANGSTAATQKGGGLYLSGGQATVTHCTFRQNYAVSGGGLALDAASTLTNCRFVGNAATNGGAVYANGSTATPSFVSCLFHGNTASSYGGAIISLTSANTKITNCTLYANTASTAGGGVCTTYPRWTDGIVTTVNSIFWANRDASSYTQAAQITAATPSVKYCCVQGWTGSFGGTGNMGTDPLFVDADGADDIAGTPDDDLHLTSGSPCKDTGDNTVTQADWVDMDEQYRIYATYVDIGADEYMPSKVATPVFSPDGGQYSSEQTVTITCSTPDAIIHYTTNGIDPTEGDPIIASGGVVTVNIAKPTALKATAFRTAMLPSDVKIAVYRNFACICVSLSGNDTNDGLSWATAKKTVSAGLSTAKSGDQVWVAAGTYTDNITLKAGVALYGGFAGNEALLEQRHWITNATILDGNQTGSVVTAPSGATTTTRIDGFTIRNGIGTALGSNRYGGGIFCDKSSPMISNNKIVRNALPTGYGGGIYCSNASPVIMNNIIADNSVTSIGGGILCFSSSPQIINNTIVGNTADSNGGGIYSLNMSSPTIINNIIALNSSGIYDTATVTGTRRNNCVFNPGGYNYSGYAPGVSDITTNPYMLAPQFGEPHLLRGSPCIDSGDDAAVPAESLDIDGQPRIQNGHVDIGADEYNGTEPSYTPNIIRVSLSGNDLNDGSSWSLSKRTIQAGIDTASTIGAEIWVAAGTYNEMIVLKSHAYLYGGFSGTEQSRDHRNWKDHPTILDGNSSGSVVSITSVPCYLSAAIDGFTIQNGIGTLLTGSRYGGGIYCTSSSPLITNNIITGNNASTSGAGIYCKSAYPLIANNILRGNDGDGIYCTSSSPMIANNAIISNWSGISCFFSSAPMVINNTIKSNGRCGIYCHTSSPTITNNTIVSNTSRGGGGGIYCYNGSPAVSNTIIAFNSSGILTSGSSSPILRNCCTYSNNAYNFSGLEDPTGTNGNISADPKLASTSYGNAHIQPDSPCKDSGTDAAVQPDWKDIDDQPRTMGTHVDIGSDESDETPWSAGLSSIIRVSGDGNDANDGSTWALAKRTVQAGIHAAALVGGEVWVKSGTYQGCITIPEYVYVYGGFAGTETERIQRNRLSYVSILDGQASSSVVSFKGGWRTNTIDGFTLRNGAGVLVNSARYGGGIYCSNAAPTIINNIITNNKMTANTAYGGGVYCSSSLAAIENNTITNNLSSDGGGIFCTSSSPSITNNTITGNTASWQGGGLYCSSSSSPLIANNRIAGNNADGSGEGGAIYVSIASPLIINNTLAANNSGIYISGNSATLIIANNTIIGNEAIAIYSSSSSATIANNIIAFNHAGLRVYSSSVALRNNNVYGNTDYNYSGISAGTKDLSVDPMLAGAEYGQVHLRANSPCIDAGDDNVIQAGWLDLDGEIRKQGMHVDIGVDEYDGTNPTPSSPAIIRVMPTGNDNNDGSSWTLAKRTVQAGIDAAALDGGCVWVAAGIYRERITVQPYAHVYGGFTGIETIQDQRNWSSNVTVLDGDAGGSVVTFSGCGYRTCSIDGLTIKNGSGTSLTHGGGIYCRNSSPSILNNIITNNIVTIGSIGNGAGIYCYRSSPEIAYNSIVGNLVNDSTVGRGGSGAGIACMSSSPTIAHNKISNNILSRPEGKGAGIYLYSSSPIITNNVISDNVVPGYGASGSGGGIYCDYASNLTILNNVISGNRAPNVGGGISCYSNGSANIASNIITHNYASYGGGISIPSTSIIVVNNLLLANAATTGGGGIYCLNNSSSKVINNTFVNNTATQGGAVYSNTASPLLANNVMTFNSSGVYKTTASGSPTLRRNDVYGNTAYNYSGITNPTGTNGNISVDPRFIRKAGAGADGTWGTTDDDYGDLRLMTVSPCIDAGSNADVPSGILTDLAGLSRFIDDPAMPDTGSGTAPIVDMGAYEMASATPGDGNRDDHVDSLDFDLFSDCYSGPIGTIAAGCSAFDFNGDQHVDATDFDTFSACYNGPVNPPGCR